MIKIEDYILLPLSERQVHLKLDEPCIERKGPLHSASVHARGLLAHVFDTTIPSGMKICACHACNNSECSNLHHLYWGTAKENRKDAKLSGTSRSIWEYMLT